MCWSIKVKGFKTNKIMFALTFLLAVCEHLLTFTSWVELACAKLYGFITFSLKIQFMVKHPDVFLSNFLIKVRIHCSSVMASHPGADTL